MRITRKSWPSSNRSPAASRRHMGVAAILLPGMPWYAALGTLIASAQNGWL